MYSIYSYTIIIIIFPLLSVCLLQIVKSRKKKAAEVMALKRRRQEIDSAQNTRTTDTMS